MAVAAFVLFIALSSTTCRVTPGHTITAESPLGQNIRSNSPPVSPMSPSSFLVLATVDGSIIIMDASTGDIQSVFSSGSPLVEASTSLGDRYIVPGIDGRLYVSNPTKTEDSDEYDDNYEGQRPSQQQLQPLSITVFDVLQNPIRTCTTSSSQENQNKETYNREGQQECGILTATKDISLFALNAENGSLMWYQDPNGKTETTSMTTASSLPTVTVLMQRQDVVVKQLSTDSGEQLWNVTLGTLEALDFDVGEGDFASSSFRPRNLEETLLLEEGIRNEGLNKYGPSDPQTNIGAGESSRPLAALPSVSFGPDGTSLAAVENGRILWTQKFDAVVASAFGLSSRGGWKSLNVLEGDFTIADDDDQGSSTDVLRSGTATRSSLMSSLPSGPPVSSRHGIMEWNPHPPPRLVQSSHSRDSHSRGNEWWPLQTRQLPSKREHFPESTGVDFYRPPSLKSVLDGNQLNLSRFQQKAEQWLNSAAGQRLTQIVRHYRLQPVTEKHRRPDTFSSGIVLRQGHERDSSGLLSVGDTQAVWNIQSPTLLLPAPSGTPIHRTSDGIFLTWKSAAAIVVAVMLLCGLLLQWFYLRKKQQWLQLLHRATEAAKLEATTDSNPAIDNTTPSHGADMHPRNVSFADAVTAVVNTLPSSNEASTVDPTAVPSSSLSSSTQHQQQQVGMIDGIPLLMHYSRYKAEFEETIALGKGGFGTVFRCKNVLDGREYAIKKVFIKHHGRQQQQPEVEISIRLNRVLREVKILALLDHPNIVRYYTAWLELGHGEDPEGNPFSPATVPSTTRDYYLAESTTPTKDSFMRRSSYGNLRADDLSTSTLGRRGYQSPSWDESRASNFDQQELSDVELDDLGFVFDRGSNEAEDNGSKCPNDKTTPDEVFWARHAQKAERTDHVHSTSLSDVHNSSHSGLFVRPSVEQSTSLARDDVTTQVSTSILAKTNKQQTPGTEDSNGDSVPLVRHTLYIQMQLCGEQTLADFLSDREARRGSSGRDGVDIPYALSLFVQIAQGVSHVHQQGLIHRDLKPNNCFIDTCGVVKVGDFGLSRESGDKIEEETDATLNSTKATVTLGDGENTAGVGTRSYASPEQMKGSDYDSSTDIYSLGLILFELCYPMYTGMERLTVFSKLRDLDFPVQWLAEIKPAFPTLDSLLVSMISRRPSDRPSADTVAQIIQSILEEYTIQSLDRQSEHEDSIFLRVETRPREDALQHTIQLIKNVAAPFHVEIVQYGLRGVRDKAIMEFAISSSNDADISTLGPSIVSKMNQNEDVLLIRQVSAP